MSPERRTRRQGVRRRTPQKAVDEGRRRLLKLGGGLLALSTLGGVAAALKLSSGSDEQPEATQSLQIEAERMGATRSPDETDLWRKAIFSPLRTEDVNAKAQETYSRVKSTVDFMQKSKNPYFTEAGNYLKSALDSKDTSLGLRTQTVFNGNLVSIMTTRPEVDNGKLNWWIDMTINEVLKYKDGVQLAITLTHEARHLKNSHEYDKTLGDLSADQRYSKHLERVLNPDTRLKEEADAYGIQSQAYIFQTGLMGVRDLGSESDSIAQNFIKLGQNAENPAWQQYIQSRGSRY